MSWTPERESTLKELWCAGRSASQIAQVLGNTTRNAVIGKAHRLGLSGRVSPSVRTERVSVTRMASNHSLPHEPREARPKVQEVPEERSEHSVSLLGLTERACKWPVGDPRSADFHFCGRPKDGDLSYCGHHAAIAFQIPTKRDHDTKKAIG